MRTAATASHLRLRPHVDLAPLVNALNADEPSDALRGGVENQLVERLTGSLATVGKSSRHLAARIAIEHFAGRAYLLNERFVGAQFGNRFLVHMRAEGVFDPDTSFQAWFEVWRFLRTVHPALDGRITQCSFCAAFFVRYHQTDVFCSPLCRVAPSLVKDLPPSWKQAAKRRLLEVSRRVSKTEAAFDERYGPTARQCYRLLIDPMVAGRVEPLDSLRDVSDRGAFIAAWRFVFSQRSDARRRLRECAVCKRLFCAYHTKQRTCGRECQMMRYRRERRSGNEPAGSSKLRRK
jgi:hypothetical protein